MLRFIKSLLRRRARHRPVDEAVEPSEQMLTDVNIHSIVPQLPSHHARAKEVLEGLIKTLPEDHPAYGGVLNNLGVVLRAEADYARAKRAFERATVIWEASLGKKYHLAAAVNNLGGVLRAQGDYTGAQKAFERAIDILETSVGEQRPSLAAAVNNLGLVLQAQGDYDGARQAFERALRIDEAVLGPVHTEVATDLNNLGILQAEMGKLDTGILSLMRALRMRMFFLPEGHPYIQNTWNAFIYYQLKKIIRDKGVSEEEAVKILKRRLWIE
ncbi:MAG: tetratricopeptide repeat protein [Chloroflexi bacterium]|nr:tetratricopeptide repeat protein [Chloroflexota bacterium]